MSEPKSDELHVPFVPSGLQVCCSRIVDHFAAPWHRIPITWLCRGLECTTNCSMIRQWIEVACKMHVSNIGLILGRGRKWPPCDTNWLWVTHVACDSHVNVLCRFFHLTCCHIQSSLGSNLQSWRFFGLFPLAVNLGLHTAMSVVLCQDWLSVSQLQHSFRCLLDMQDGSMSSC